MGKRGYVDSEEENDIIYKEDEMGDVKNHVSSDKRKNQVVKKVKTKGTLEESDNEGDSSDRGTSTKSYDVSSNKVVLRQQISKIIIAY